jgi:hypothetical protein
MTAARRGATPAMAPGQDGLLTPQLLVLEGGLGLPGLVRWVTAFTNGPADASLLHRAFFHAYIGPQGQPGPVEWRLESQGLGLAPPPPTRILQAEALSLGAALDAAVAAATRLATSAGQAAALGPAFVQLHHQPGLPRVWGCAGLVAAPGGPANRFCFLRERLGGPAPRFDGTLDCEAGPPRHWHAATLAEAAEQGRAMMLG